MMADAIVSHRIVPRRGSFRLEAVTATGAIEVLAVLENEDKAVEQLRILQCAADERGVLEALAAKAV
jgi:hypothetical protein